MDTLDGINYALRETAVLAGRHISSFQSIHEDELIEAIHTARLDGTQAIIINPAAYTHTSVAILDTLNAFEGKVLEVHISNVQKRENFRHHSYVSLRADGIIVGFGTQGYQMALNALINAVVYE